MEDAWDLHIITIARIARRERLSLQQTTITWRGRMRHTRKITFLSSTAGRSIKCPTSITLIMLRVFILQPATESPFDILTSPDGHQDHLKICSPLSIKLTIGLVPFALNTLLSVSLPLANNSTTDLASSKKLYTRIH